MYSRSALTSFRTLTRVRVDNDGCTLAFTCFKAFNCNIRFALRSCTLHLRNGTQPLFLLSKLSSSRSDSCLRDELATELGIRMDDDHRRGWPAPAFRELKFSSTCRPRPWARHSGHWLGTGCLQLLQCSCCPAGSGQASCGKSPDLQMAAGTGQFSA